MQSIASPRISFSWILLHLVVVLLLTWVVRGSEETMKGWPDRVQKNSGILAEEEKEVVQKLLSMGQHHLFGAWDAPGTNDDAKHRFLAQVQQVNTTCGNGGIESYLNRAKKLLTAARGGDNPFDGWKPKVPHGVNLEPFTPEYSSFETSGMPELGFCGFVLVAGGLGERLGYSGIKIELPVETVTRTSYIAHYIDQILSIQKRYGDGRQLPLAIMVSDDTHDKTVDLLRRNNNFGMAEGQITLLKQGKVPALVSNQAQMALTSTYELDTKPHGHGDVHSLMHQTGTAHRWLSQGTRWVVFFQDTNGLSFHTLPAMVGVSVQLQLVVNSLAVPRFAKQSVGAITKLVNEVSGQEMTINVEYNQLDPLLRATISPEGDVNDPATGLSPFPGNINQLLFALPTYNEVLEASQGLMPEFVNPKYKDSTRTVFKKPTRLECMMQDFPRLLQGTNHKVGFTMAPAWLCYSPCKNNAQDAAASIATGVPAASPYTAESDQYAVWAEMLRRLGAHIPAAESMTMLGVPAVPGPRIVIKPSTAIFPCEVRALVRGDASNISLTARSTLVVEGEVFLEKLALDGSLQVVAPPSGRVIVRTSSGPVVNRGHRLRILSHGAPSSRVSEMDTMRGYLLEAEDVKVIRATSEEDSTEPVSTWLFNGQHMVSVADSEWNRSHTSSLQMQVSGTGVTRPTNCFSCLDACT